MLTYFLQVNVCWLLFYALYYALLSKETFFKLNRIYLIVSLLSGLVIPVSISKVDMPTAMPIIEVVQPIVLSFADMQTAMTMEMQQTAQPTWGIWSLLTALYLVGLTVFLLKFCWGLYTICQLYRNGEKQLKNGIRLIYTEGVKSPFSFFNWIFVNQNTIESNDYQQIIQHESAHVRQKHSLDIVGLEILRGLFWLSPMVHLYARSLRHVHEYLADAAVLQNTEKKSYGRLLISQTAAGSGLVIANHLNFSQLKKRFIMMSRNPSQRLALVKYTFAAPVFLLIVALLASPKTKIMANTEGGVSQVESAIKKVDNQLFNKKNEPPFLMLPSGKQSGYISLTELKQLDYLIAKVTEQGKTRILKILKFNVLLTSSFFTESPSFHSKKEAQDVVNEGANFSEALKKLLAAAEEGDEIFISPREVFDKEKNKNVATRGLILTIKSDENKDVNTRIVRSTDGKVDTVNMVKSSNKTSKATQKLMTFIKTNTRVPQYIFDKKLSGCVFVHFNLDDKGNTTAIESEPVFTDEKKNFVNSEFDDCKKEALRILKIIPKDLLKELKKQHEESAVKTKMFIPVNFPTKNY